MDKEKILTGLKTSLSKMPDIDQVGYSSEEVSSWIGKTHSLLHAYDKSVAIQFQVKSENLGIQLFREKNWVNMRNMLVSAISTLESEYSNHSQIYEAGDTYRIYRDLKEILQSAKSSLFIVDPYIDEDLFDLYVDGIFLGVEIHILTKNMKDPLKKVIKKYKQKEGINLTIRESLNIHDRLIIVDTHSCWLLGQSIKDAAKKSPTYIVSLIGSLVSGKLEYYRAIWQKAEIDV